MDHDDVTSRFERARHIGEAALALLWAEFVVERGQSEASALWWRLFSDSDASET